MTTADAGRPGSVRGRVPSRLARLVLALAALAQLLAIGVTPFLERPSPSRLGAHVEAYGTGLHRVHDESLCASCVVRHLASAPVRAVPPLPAVTRAAFLPPSVVRTAVVVARRTPDAPRAPPLRAA